MGWSRNSSLFTGHQPNNPDLDPHHKTAEYPLHLTDENGNVTRVQMQDTRLATTIPKADLELLASRSQTTESCWYSCPHRAPFQGRPREVEFINRINLIFVLWRIDRRGHRPACWVSSFHARFTRPIRELTNATHAVSEGDLSQHVPIRSNDELGELAKAFNKMSTELARSVNARKQMTADIAHELRTPLSLILGHAEAVHDGVLPPTPENFEIIREEATRLEHLVNDLRTLSLADAGELTISRKPSNQSDFFRKWRHYINIKLKRKTSNWIWTSLRLFPPLKLILDE